MGKSSTDEKLHALAANLREHVAWLTRDGDRSWGRPHRLHQVADRIQQLWEEQGYAVTRDPIPGLDRAPANLLAGPTADTWQGAPYILGAHYDTVPGTPGADDNASGVAVMLEVSRLLATSAVPAEPRPPVVFVAFALEEPPFFLTPQQGSRHLVARMGEQGATTRGALILEMVGYYSKRPGSQRYPFPVGLLGYPETGDFCGLIANWRSRHLLAPLRAAIRGAGLPAESLWVPGDGHLLPAVRLSDHASFWDHDLPAVMLTDTSFFRNPHYHEPGDTASTLDFESMALLVQGLAGFLSGPP